jgi:ABC-type multidrug transport system fused ATPase/permease subunit
MVAGWYHAVLLAAVPWVVWWQPRWAPLLVGGAVLVHLHVRRTRAAEPWSSLAVVLSAAAALLLTAGWSGPVWTWLALAGVVAATARFIPRGDGGRPDASDCMAVVAWAAPFALDATLLALDRGGWLAPALLLLTARHLGTVVATTTTRSASMIGPPTRDVRGTLSLRGVVATGGGLPATVPLELDLRAGESLAVLCTEPTAAQALADVLAGRSRPFRGELLVDGAPVGDNDRLVAVIAPGEPFVPGGLDDNLAALRDEPPDRSTRAAARDACTLADVVETLDGRSLAPDGAPLDTGQRLRVLAARVLVSHYRVVVVVDPIPWVDARSAERWRTALVRASVGRTAVWITTDPELADRADHHHELVDGSLRAR